MMMNIKTKHFSEEKKNNKPLLLFFTILYVYRLTTAHNSSQLSEILTKKNKFSHVIKPNCPKSLPFLLKKIYKNTHPLGLYRVGSLFFPDRTIQMLHPFYDFHYQPANGFVCSDRNPCPHASMLQTQMTLSLRVHAVKQAAMLEKREIERSLAHKNTVYHSI